MIFIEIELMDYDASYYILRENLFLIQLGGKKKLEEERTVSNASKCKNAERP